MARNHDLKRADTLRFGNPFNPLSIVGEYGAICAFRLPGMKTHAQAELARAAFLQKHGILVVNKGGLASGPVLRVTPSLFNTTAELDRLVQAMQSERRLLL